MPLPILGVIAAGLAVGKGVLDHVDASNTNDLAQWKMEEAQKKFENEKTALETFQANVKESLLDLGKSKKSALEVSFPYFLHGYERIKNIKFNETESIHEISKFVIDDKNVGEIKELSSTFLPSVTAGVTGGTAVGTLISFASGGSALFLASGAASMLGMGATTAGTLLSLGAPGLALSALGSGVASAAGLMAGPLAAFVAPAVLFSGLSAKGKADKNYDKAKEYEAEVDKAVEQMKNSATVCQGIIDRSKMFDDLLKKLDQMFYICARKLDVMTGRKVNEAEGRDLQLEDFSDDEINLIAVTRSLAGAVKSILDTPILSSDGSLTNESQDMGDRIKKSLPEFDEKYSIVTSG